MSSQNNGLSHPDERSVSMSKDKSASTPIPTPTSKGRSLDAWALIVAMLLALAVKFDVFKNVPW
jgi:hypothetical protein